MKTRLLYRIPTKWMLIAVLFCFSMSSGNKAQADEEEPTWWESAYNTIKEFWGDYGWIAGISGPIQSVLDLVFPEPSTADLIEDAVRQIKEEIKGVRDQELRDNVAGLINLYYFFREAPCDEDVWDWLVAAEMVRSNIYGVLNDRDDLRSAVYLIKSFNLLTPIEALMLRIHGNSNETIRDVLLCPAHDINLRFLGDYCMSEHPTIPCYRSDQGRLYQAYQDGILSTDEYMDLRDTLWKANEDLRKFVVPTDHNVWFHIAHRGATPECIIYSDDGSTLSSEPYDSHSSDFWNYMWQFNYVDVNRARIVHSSGKCLAASECCPPDAWLIDCGSSPFDGDIWYVGILAYSNEDFDGVGMLQILGEDISYYYYLECGYFYPWPYIVEPPSRELIEVSDEQYIPYRLIPLLGLLLQ